MNHSRLYKAFSYLFLGKLFCLKGIAVEFPLFLAKLNRILSVLILFILIVDLELREGEVFKQKETDYTATRNLAAEVRYFNCK